MTATGFWHLVGYMSVGALAGFLITVVLLQVLLWVIRSRVSAIRHAQAALDSEFAALQLAAGSLPQEIAKLEADAGAWLDAKKQLDERIKQAKHDNDVEALRAAELEVSQVHDAANDIERRVRAARESWARIETRVATIAREHKNQSRRIAWVMRTWKVIAFLSNVDAEAESP